MPENLLRFWLGHADRSVTDGYSKVKEDVEFRKEVCAEAGLGFQIPAENQTQNRNFVPNCTQDVLEECVV